MGEGSTGAKAPPCARSYIQSGSPPRDDKPMTLIPLCQPPLHTRPRRILQKPS
ncbi:hypothetical protein BGW80DRAFT_1356541 [Lactifluus volemus]|nr:hypothetical protein BGW80DRAFT_1356541 [Lactifluus volemus]